MSYRTLEYTLTFTTPAFLGNAEQSGQWRTPPFKALLRQWWRVVYATRHGFDVDVARMRREEGILFGHAWLDNDLDTKGKKVAARKGAVRMRLDNWTLGKLKVWPSSDVTIKHPEVANAVGSQLYLGYGPLVFRSGTALKANAAIQAGGQAQLALAVPDDSADAVVSALSLMNAYGTAGGRSRNGWGSFVLHPIGGASSMETSGYPCVRAWRDCLNLDWPHAVGRDEKGPLIWESGKAHDDWQGVMRELAIVKIGLRTQFAFPSAAPPHSQPLPRHWLSYPITRHGTKAWNRNARLPNSLRFKVRPAATDAKKLRGVIFQVPCCPPAEFQPNRSAIEKTWGMVHALLDELTSRSGRDYPMIVDAKRRTELKIQLDTIALERVKA